MESLPSASKVSFSTEVDWRESEVQWDSNFDYVESTSEASSGDEDDAEDLETFLGAVYATSPSKGNLAPAERQSLLLFDKDCGAWEELESGIYMLTILRRT